MTKKKLFLQNKIGAHYDKKKLGGVTDTNDRSQSLIKICV